LPRSAGCSQSAWISATQTAILRRESSVSNDPESYEPWPLPARESFEASTMPDWLRDAYMLALWTGQRESDVLRLSRSRFDGNGFVVRQGRPEAKRGKGRRGPVVTLYVPAAAPLRAYPARRIFTGLLFVSDAKGKPVRADELRKTMRAHLDSLGLYNLHFHGLRHSDSARRGWLHGP
jgi:integrase